MPRKSPAGRPASEKGSSPSQAGSQKARSGLLDTFRGRYDKLDIHLDQPEYQNIDELSGARMLGHFVQSMQNQGFPWKLHEASADDKSGFKKGPQLSDIDALRRLQQGQPLWMQPMRDLQLDLSSNSLSAVSAAGNLAGQNLGGLAAVADASKSTQISAGSQGITIKNGEPIVINSLAELKLLNQLYNSDQKLESADRISRAAHQMSYFTQKTLGTNYPWRFYTKDEGNTALRMAKHTARGALGGGAVGAVAGTLVGTLLGIVSPSINVVSGAMYGAGIMGAVAATIGGYGAAQSSLKGNPINAVEALERIVSGEEVMFQESRARSTPLPLISKMSWFFDQGKASSIKSVEELNTFFYLQSGAELPKPPEPKKEPPPTVLVVDQSVHHHVTNHVFAQG